MPGRPVSEVVQQAAEALNQGNYRLAVETCRRVLGQFPEFTRAYRLLAEALLAQGDLPAAERALQETLRREPQSAAAYAGLGKIAELRGDQEAAIAYLQAAWENAPRDQALREHVSRLSERLYGPGGRLHLTRAGLATLHAESGRWSRAATEAGAVLEDHPTRLDTRLRLAESLWRRGRDDEAATAAQAVLDTEPLAVRALLILADIERRRGRQEQATALVERAHAIDLDGVLAGDLISVADTAGAFLRPRGMPMLTEEAVASERPRIAPTPPAASPAAASGPAPPAQNGTTNISFDLGLMSQEEAEAARPSVKAFEAFDEVFRTIEGAGVEPFSFDAPEPAAEAPEFEPEPEQTSGLVSDQDLPAITEDLTAEPPTSEPPVQEPQPSAPAAEAVAPEAPPEVAAAAAQPLVQAVERGASALRASIERLGVDEALFERARAAKAQLVGRAQISGTKLVPGGEPSGPSREDLEQAVAANPEDVAARRQLAGALVAAGEGRRALEQCRWFYHHRQADADIVAELERLAQPGEMVAAAAQRLLGAIFRRDGQFMRSALHYQLALELQLPAGAGTKNKDEGR